MVFIAKEDVQERYCLRHVGPRDSNAFCLGRKVKGFTSCGMSTHRAKRLGPSKKFVPPEDHIWIPGPMNSGMLIALKDPVLNINGVHAARLHEFQTASNTTREWLCVFANTTNDINQEDEDDYKEMANKSESMTMYLEEEHGPFQCWNYN
jgi:hypothetical protein